MASTQMLTGGLGAAARSPPVNSSESPGSSGKSRPVSMKTMIRMPGSTAEAKSPPSPSQYIGSRMLGRANTVVVIKLKIPLGGARPVNLAV